MSETIQKLTYDVTIDECRAVVEHGDGVVAARRAFLEHAAGLYQHTLSAAQLDELAALDDRAALQRAFPWLSDAEHHEALWAMGAGTW